MSPIGKVQIRRNYRKYTDLRVAIVIKLLEVQELKKLNTLKDKVCPLATFSQHKKWKTKYQILYLYYTYTSSTLEKSSSIF